MPIKTRGFSARPFLPIQLAIVGLLVGFAEAKANVLLDVTASIGDIDQISSTGSVSTLATFLGSSDIGQGIVLGQNGTLYVADSGEGILWTCSPSGALNPWASTGNNYSYGLVQGSGGNFYAAIQGLGVGQIDKITPSGSVTTFATLPSQAGPDGLAFNSSGDLFVGDENLGKVYEITPGGSVSTYLTLPAGSTPTGLTFDPNGDLYVATFGGKIYEVPSGGSLTSFATLSSKAGLTGLAYANNELFVAEQNANEIVEINSQDDITDFASLPSPEFIEVVPEPSTVILFGAGLVFFAVRVRREQLNGGLPTPDNS